ncbi:hypothetical protein, partial [Proteiniphilum sp.]|uniref:hypothetical protein n=1 Tax=Proteiniphilum sp. TaxID=1926877 RepID=UPI002B202832
MATYEELKQRIGELKSRTGRSSISPDDTFGLVEELLDKLEGVDMNAASMSVKKIYPSHAAMTADNAPVSDDGKPLKPGQLVAVNNEADVSENSVYRYLAPGWEQVDRLGDLSDYAKQDDLVQLAGEKADHGYASSPKTLKDVEELASAKIPNLVLNGDLHNGLTGWT